MPLTNGNSIRAAFLAVDVTIPLYTQEVWGLNSTKVGLVFIAAIVPTMICRCRLSFIIQRSARNSINIGFSFLGTLPASPIAGYLSDKIGPEFVAAAFLMVGIPWWAALTKRFSLVFFVVSFAVESELSFFLFQQTEPVFQCFQSSTRTNANASTIDLFIGAVVSPITTELAAVARAMDGIGCTFHFLLPGAPGFVVVCSDARRHGRSFRCTHVWCIQYGLWVGEHGSVL